MDMALPPIKRDDKGRILPGQRALNPTGRPTKRKEELYLTSMQRCATVERWEAIVNRALDDAADGNASARTWLSNYLLGKPAQHATVQIENNLALDETARLHDMVTILQFILERERDNGNLAIVIDNEGTS